MGHGSLKSIYSCVIALTLVHAGYGQEYTSPKEALELKYISAYWRDRDYSNAKNQILLFLDKHPHSPMRDRLNAMLGDLYIQEGAYAQALAVYDQIFDPAIRDQISFNILQIHFKIQDYDWVIENALKVGHEEIKVRYMLAEAAYRKALTTKQVEYLEIAKPHFEALMQTEFADSALFSLAETHRLLKENSEAYPLYLQLAEKFPAHREGFLFQAAAMSEDKKEAATIFHQVYAMGGKRAPLAALNELILLYQNREFEEYLAFYPQVVEQIPREKTALLQYYEGSSFYALGVYDRAATSLRAYVKSTHSKELKSALLLLINCSVRLKDAALLEQTMQTFKAKFPKEPEFSKILFIHAQMCYDRGNFADALEDLKVLASNFPDFEENEKVFESIELILEQANKFHTDAEETLRLVAERSPQDFQYHLSKVRRLCKHSKYEEAISQLKQLLPQTRDKDSQNILHLELYNAYLSLAQNKTDQECDQLLCEAADHLFESRAWENGSINRENLLWLTQHFCERAKDRPQEFPYAIALINTLAERGDQLLDEQIALLKAFIQEQTQPELPEQSNEQELIAEVDSEDTSEPTIVVQEEECTPLFDSCLCDPGPSNARITARTRQAGGIGYPTGYTSFDLFYAPGSRGDFTPFIDLRAHVFNNGKPAFNTGLGLRYQPACYDMIWGVNAYWDYRQAKHSAFNQIGLGFEALWPKWDLHFNTYIPINYKKSYRTGFQKFQGNEAFFYKKYELSLWGGDLAVGYQLYDCDCFNLHATLDGYYFHGNYGKQAVGTFLRLRSNLWDYVSVEGQVSYDSLFKWNGQGEIAVSIPFGKPLKRYSRKTDCCNTITALEQRLVEKPDRFEIMPTTSHKTTARARDPITGEPLRFLFVDNTSHSAGTFESPYPTLAQAVAVSQPGDVIYIFPGNGTSSGLNTSTTLKDRQSLVGSGAPFEVATRFGNLVIPQMSDTLPFIEVLANIAVIPTSHNTISGLKIFSRTLSAVGSGSTVSDLSILKCRLAGTVAETINIPNGLQGLNRIEDNLLFSLSPVFGIAMNINSRNNDRTTLFINRNTFDGTAFGISLGTAALINSHDNSQMQLFMENNQVLAFNNGLNAAASEASTIHALIRENLITINGISPNGGIIAVSEQTAIARYIVELNQISAPTTETGIDLQARDSSTMTSRLDKNRSTGLSPILIEQLVSSSITMDSPNGSLSGLQNINTGQISKTGTIQFAPLQ